MPTKPLILLGGGGHCKSVIDVAESAGYAILGVLDKPELVGSRIGDYQIIGTDDDIAKYADNAEFVITVGQIKSPAIRQKLDGLVKQFGGNLATIVADDAYVSKYANLGEGTVIMHKAFVNADAIVGRNCIVNTMANIEHDCRIGDFCHISTGATINGNVIIDECSFIGSQSAVNQGVKIESNVVVGSGSVVTSDISANNIVVGVPAKSIIQIYNK